MCILSFKIFDEIFNYNFGVACVFIYTHYMSEDFLLLGVKNKSA